MRKEAKIEIIWENPPDGTATLRRVIGGEVYERKITPSSRLTPPEAKAVLKLTHARVHQLLKSGQLKSTRKGGDYLVSLKELIRYSREKRPRGRPRNPEAFLIN